MGRQACVWLFEGERLCEWEGRLVSGCVKERGCVNGKAGLCLVEVSEQPKERG